MQYLLELNLRLVERLVEARQPKLGTFAQRKLASCRMPLKTHLLAQLLNNFPRQR